jgi:curved DNA-binding protein CbpA
MNRDRTHYEVLGVAPTASADEIRRAWKTLIQVWHPDRFSGLLRTEAEKMTKAINDAYQVLSRPHSRVQYDREAAVPGGTSHQPRKAQAGSTATGVKDDDDLEYHTRADQIARGIVFCMFIGVFAVPAVVAGQYGDSHGRISSVELQALLGIS